MIHTDGRPTVVTAQNTVDVVVVNHGTLFTFQPLTSAARTWIQESVEEDAQYLGDLLCVEHRYAFDLADGLLDAGFVLR